MFGSEAFAEYTFADAFSSARVSFTGDSALTISREFRIFSATSEFTTKDSDKLSSTPFFGTLAQPLSFSRSLVGSDIIGNFSSGTGELELTNTDGGYDFLIQGFAIDGRPIVVKTGREGDAYDKFYTIFSGTASDWIVAEDSVTIKLVDNAYLLDVPAQANNYAGTGGLEGTADLKGKRKPRSFGVLMNITPAFVLPASLLYQVNDGTISGVPAVYDRGAALTFQADFATSALLLAASITSGFYGTCIAEGFFRIGTAATGTITADVNGDNKGGTWWTSSANIIRRLLQSSTIADPQGLYLPSFSAVNSSSIGYYIAPDDTNTIADVISNIMAGIGGWGGFRRSGQFELGIFKTPAGAIPNAFFDRVDVMQISREALPTSLTPPPYRFRCSYGHNWTVQDSDLASSVSTTRRSLISQTDRYSDSTDLTVKSDHPFANDRDPITSYFTNQSDAQAESDRLLALYRKGAALYRVSLGVQPFALDLGDVVNLTYPRWDLTVGRNLRLVEMTENAKDNTIEIVAYG